MKKNESLDFVEDIAALPGETVLDIGARDCGLASALESRGKRVITLDIRPIRHVDHIQCNFMEGPNTNPLNQLQRVAGLEGVDIVVASHIFEHVMNKGRFLQSVRALLGFDGHFVCIVPPLKHEIVGGHVNLFNMGLLIYNLILGGFDCRNGRFTTRNYSLAGIVQPDARDLPALNHDQGDIELLADRFPFDAHQGFDGRIKEVNWVKP